MTQYKLLNNGFEKNPGQPRVSTFVPADPRAARASGGENTAARQTPSPGPRGSLSGGLGARFLKSCGNRRPAGPGRPRVQSFPKLRRSGGGRARAGAGARRQRAGHSPPGAGPAPHRPRSPRRQPRARPPPARDGAAGMEPPPAARPPAARRGPLPRGPPPTGSGAPGASSAAVRSVLLPGQPHVGGRGRAGGRRRRRLESPGWAATRLAHAAAAPRSSRSSRSLAQALPLARWKSPARARPAPAARAPARGYGPSNGAAAASRAPPARRALPRPPFRVKKPRRPRGGPERCRFPRGRERWRHPAQQGGRARPPPRGPHSGSSAPAPPGRSRPAPSLPPAALTLAHGGSRTPTSSLRPETVVFTLADALTRLTPGALTHTPRHTHSHAPTRSHACPHSRGGGRGRPRPPHGGAPPTPGKSGANRAPALVCPRCPELAAGLLPQAGDSAPQATTPPLSPPEAFRSVGPPEPGDPHFFRGLGPLSLGHRVPKAL